MLDLQSAKIKALAKTVGTVWNNQVSISESIDRLEEEFCVLGRLMIPKMNEILISLGSDDLITEEIINNVYLTWNEFKKRSDFKSYFVPWFLGVPIDEMPEVKQEEEKTLDAPAESKDAEVFGGDYGEGQANTIGDEATQEGGLTLYEASATHEVPEVQDADEAVPGAEQDGGTAVPEVPDRV